MCSENFLQEQYERYTATNILYETNSVPLEAYQKMYFSMNRYDPSRHSPRSKCDYCEKTCGMLTLKQISLEKMELFLKIREEEIRCLKKVLRVAKNWGKLTKLENADKNEILELRIVEKEEKLELTKPLMKKFSKNLIFQN